MNRSRQGSRFYDRQAAGYDRRWSRYQRATHEMLLAYLDGPFRQVLDLGCGTGTLLQRLLTRYPGATGFGIDASQEMLAVAGHRLAGLNARLFRANARHISLPDRSVDLITMASVVHYLRSPFATFGEARRVLRARGILAMVDYELHGLGGSFVDGLIRLYDPGHVRSRGLAELTSLLTRAGFAIIAARQFSIDRVFAGVIIVARAPISDAA